MINKLAALFAILATMLLLGTWCLRYGTGLGIMEPERLLLYALGCLVGYYIFGIVVARVSIGLVDEVLSDMRSREARHRALLDTPAPAPSPDAEKADAKAVPDAGKK